jgi:hypothetical protein
MNWGECGEEQSWSFLYLPGDVEENHEVSVNIARVPAEIEPVTYKLGNLSLKPICSFMCGETGTIFPQEGPFLRFARECCVVS